MEGLMGHVFPDDVHLCDALRHALVLVELPVDSIHFGLLEEDTRGMGTRQLLHQRLRLGLNRDIVVLTLISLLGIKPGYVPLIS